jgi:hypothetical protein
VTYTRDDLAQVLAKLDQMAGPVPTPDPAQVQGELHAFLVQRGRQVAQDLRLPHATDQELAQLGRLDCIDQHPGLDPDLAVALETIAAGRGHNPFPSWDEQVAAHQGHRHARNETCSEPGPGPAPEAGQPPRPTESGLGIERH